MVYVYILKLNNDKLYVGSSRDLRKRITQHQAGRVSYTHPLLPLKLIYYEAYIDEADARRREQYLKTGRGREMIKSQLFNFFNTRP